jgi:hypothetical protein
MPPDLRVDPVAAIYRLSSYDLCGALMMKLPCREVVGATMLKQQGDVMKSP